MKKHDYTPLPYRTIEFGDGHKLMTKTNGVSWFEWSDYPTVSLRELEDAIKLAREFVDKHAPPSGTNEI